MSEANYCDQGGWLVSDPIPVPDDPCDYWARGAGATLGCSRLRCQLCEAWVRSAREVYVPDVASRLAELQASADWSTLAGAQPVAGLRTYACACTGWVETALNLTSPREPEPSDPDLPWRCAGHPLPTLPLDVDGLVVQADTDFEPLVSRVAAGWVPGGVQGHFRNFPGEWLCRLYLRLRGLPQAARLALAIARKMAGPDEFERGCGLLFYDRFPDAPGQEGVAALGLRDGGRGMLATSRVRFESGFFHFSPLRVLRGRLSEGADLGDLQGPVVAACQAALLAGESRDDHANLATVAQHDDEWLASHAAEVVRAHPARLDGVLDLLRLSRRDELLAIGGIALMSAGDVDQEALAHWLERQGNLESPGLFVLREALARRRSDG